MSNKHSILRFALKTTDSPFEVMGRFHPQGKTLLNRTEWRGKEPRSCGVTKVTGRADTAGSTEPHVWDIEVAYRPKGTITYVGNTKYDGWTAMMLNRKRDGTLLDQEGNPLPEGEPPIFLPVEVYEDIDFNDLEFGDYVGEFEVGGIPHLSYAELMEQIEKSGSFSAGIGSSFIAPRRTRPSVKIVLSNDPSGTGRDGFGTRIIHVNNYTPQLKQVILDHVTETITGFMEGRYSIKNFSTSEFTFVDLDDMVVDCTPNEEGKDSRFGVLHEYVPETFLDDTAKWLMSTYEVDVTIVDGPEGGLLIKRLPPRRG